MLVAFVIFNSIFLSNQIEVVPSLKCDPKNTTRISLPDDNHSFMYCAANGSLVKETCSNGIFDLVSHKCTGDADHLFAADDPFLSPQYQASDSSDDLFLLPQYQAPDDICENGLPLTQLGAPILCNPSRSSCPDGYICSKHRRSNVHYCCKASLDTLETDPKSVCDGGQVTYMKSNGVPKSCDLSEANSCPQGFNCNLLKSGATRCCAKDFGCPVNSAAFIDSRTKLHRRCSLSNPSSCEFGFSCVLSSTYKIPICCSSADEKISEVCPVGLPKPNGPTRCSQDNPCDENYQCIRNANQYYCCPSPESVCKQRKDSGSSCSSSRHSVFRFYFDSSTSSCRSFNYDGCGGNDNNFQSLEQCQGFCLENQCEIGISQRVNGVSVGCSTGDRNVCQRQYTCQRPLFGFSDICCPTTELACEDVVSAGVACFSKSFAAIRYYFNSETQKCQAFEYYGCSGSSNNFRNKEQCEKSCLKAYRSVCNGPAALQDPNGQLQKCSTRSPCPAGYACNKMNFCCPTPSYACAASLNIGNTCSSSSGSLAWYYDSSQRSCRPFNYLGCGGGANHFDSQDNCEATCIVVESIGDCPMGMSPQIRNNHPVPKTCSLNNVGSCPAQWSCVLSTKNVPICCRTMAQCPPYHSAYIIDGSDSMVSCRKGEKDCPDGSECLESSVKGFFICCQRTNNNNINYHAQNINYPVQQPIELIHEPECPDGIRFNGRSCTTSNQCPKDHVCLLQGRHNGYCCAAKPKCLRGQTNLDNGKASICGPNYADCPKGSGCLVSSVPSVHVCCHMASELTVPKFFTSSQHLCPNSRTPYYDPGSFLPRQCLTMRAGQCPDKFTCQAALDGGLFYCCPVSPNECPNGEKAYISVSTGTAQECHSDMYGCPIGYSCQRVANEYRSVCCPNQVAMAQCPVGSSAYYYGNRPLACPPGSNRCPAGYTCSQSNLMNIYLCCSVAFNAFATCLQGTAFIDPVSNNPQICSLTDIASCPPGYFCQQSSQIGQSICCTMRKMNVKYKGYCPVGQVPYVSKTVAEPRTCHMVLRPCPNMAQFTCIFSAEKQDSYCCTPIETMYHMSPRMMQPKHNDISGCPFGSHPLVGMGGTIQTCNPGNCPTSFMCQFSAMHNRWQCCSLAMDVMMRSQPEIPMKPASECEPESALVKDRCMKLYYIGQKGCELNEQCSAKLTEARCEKSYCVCPRNKLIHQSKCVTHCPEGFIDIAARCHDLTTIVFMDSVDNRANGTIGGFCKGTIIAEEQCDIENSFCNERSMTCYCKPGYDLKLDFESSDDKGSCVKSGDSKFSEVETESQNTSEDTGEVLDSQLDSSNATLSDDLEFMESILFQSDN